MKSDKVMKKISELLPSKDEHFGEEDHEQDQEQEQEQREDISDDEEDEDEKDGGEGKEAVSDIRQLLISVLNLNQRE